MTRAGPRLLLLLAGCASCSPEPAPDVEPAPSTRRAEPLLVEPRLHAALADRASVDALLTLPRPGGTPGPDRSWRQAIHQTQEAALACLPDGEAALRTRYRTLPMLHVRLDADALRALHACPAVEAVGLDAPEHPHLRESVPFTSADAVGSRLGTTGEGVTVAVVDSGVRYDLPEMGGCLGSGCTVVWGRDVADDDSDPIACDGHGANVAATVAGVNGMAPGAQVVALKITRDTSCTSASISDIVEALDEVLDKRDTYDIVAVNYSFGSDSGWGRDCDADVVKYTAAVQTLVSADILFVTSAGNTGEGDGVGYPACLSDAIAVANVYDEDLPDDPRCAGEDGTAGQVHCGSSGGPLIDVAAPGTVISASGVHLHGTSMAAPHVAGAAALLYAVAPDADVETVRGWLTASPRTTTDRRSGRAFTYPLLDVEDAFEAALADLEITAVRVVDGSGSGTDGDGDGRPEAGELVAVYPEVRNPGPVGWRGVVLTIPDDEATFQTTARVGDVPAGSTTPAETGLRLRLPGCTEGTTPLDLTARLTDARGWQRTAPLTVEVACTQDDDGDGIPASEDCDDRDATVFPGADETCNGIDDDCDGSVDEEAVDAPLRFPDADGDGFGTGEGVPTCAPASGRADRGGDCDDTEPRVFPEAVERCDGLDNDCNDAIDDGAVDARAWFLDGDADGFGAGEAVSACQAPEGHVATFGDCDDDDAEHYPLGPGLDATCGSAGCAQVPVGLTWPVLLLPLLTLAARRRLPPGAMPLNLRARHHPRGCPTRPPRP